MDATGPLVTARKPRDAGNVRGIGVGVDDEDLGGTTRNPVDLAVVREDATGPLVTARKARDAQYIRILTRATETLEPGFAQFARAQALHVAVPTRRALDHGTVGGQARAVMCCFAGLAPGLVQLIGVGGRAADGTGRFFQVLAGWTRN